MGTMKTYRCKNCGFEQTYRLGGGYLTFDYFAETERLEEKLKTEISEGRYGEMLKKTLDEASDEEPLECDCGTDLFQCSKCAALMVHRRKRIIKETDDPDHDVDIDLDQLCPKCHDGQLLRIRNDHDVICPSCRGKQFVLIDVILWD